MLSLAEDSRASRTLNSRATGTNLERVFVGTAAGSVPPGTFPNRASQEQRPVVKGPPRFHSRPGVSLGRPVELFPFSVLTLPNNMEGVWGRFCPYPQHSSRGHARPGGETPLIPAREGENSGFGGRTGQIPAVTDRLFCWDGACGAWRVLLYLLPCQKN